MKLEEINLQVREEIAEFDSAREDLVSRRMVLPFFTIQEMAGALQAQMLADRASEKTRDANLQAKWMRVLRFATWLSMRDDGPLWFRGYDEWNEEEGAAQIDKILAAYDAQHIVVGHTVHQTGKIRARFEGRVFLIDTGMLSTYFRGGRASALEMLDGGKFVGAYLDSDEVLFEQKQDVSKPAAD